MRKHWTLIFVVLVCVLAIPADAQKRKPKPKPKYKRDVLLQAEESAWHSNGNKLSYSDMLPDTIYIGIEFGENGTLVEGSFIFSEEDEPIQQETFDLLVNRDGTCTLQGKQVKRRYQRNSTGKASGEESTFIVEGYKISDKARSFMETAFKTVPKGTPSLEHVRKCLDLK